MPVSFRTALLTSLFLAAGPSACASSTEVVEEPTAASTAPAAQRAPLPAQQVVFSMRGNEASFRSCFLQSYGSRGVVEAIFDVDPLGSVEDVTIARSTVGHPETEACIESQIRQQRFGRPNTPARGRWTFVYRLTDAVDGEERDELLEQDAELREEETIDSVRVLPESAGRIDREAIEEVVEVNYPLFARCYRDSLSRRDESRGILHFRLRIDSEGQVVNVTDAGTILPDAYAADCMAEAFYAMRFPEPAGGDALIEYRLDID